MTKLEVSEVMQMQDSQYTERYGFGFNIIKWPGYFLASAMFRTEEEAENSQRLVKIALENSI